MSTVDNSAKIYIIASDFISISFTSCLILSLSSNCKIHHFTHLLTVLTLNFFIIMHSSSAFFSFSLLTLLDSWPKAKSSWFVVSRSKQCSKIQRFASNLKNFNNNLSSSSITKSRCLPDCFQSVYFPVALS